MSSLVHAPEMSGSPHGVFRVHAFPASATSGWLWAMTAAPAATTMLTASSTRMTASFVAVILIEVMCVSALLGVDCTPLFPISRNRLLASARARGASSCDHGHLGSTRRRHL